MPLSATAGGGFLIQEYEYWKMWKLKEQLYVAIIFTFSHFPIFTFHIVEFSLYLHSIYNYS